MATDSQSTDPARAAAEKIVNIFSVVCNMHVNDILPDIREACDAMLENAALECDRHAEFLKVEAHGGGDWKHLRTREEEALYNAQRIRAMKGKPR